MRKVVFFFILIIGIISCKKKHLKEYYGDYLFEFHGYSSTGVNGPSNFDTTYLGSISKYEIFHGNKYHRNKKIKVHYRGEEPNPSNGWNGLKYSLPISGTFFPEVDKDGNLSYPEFTESSPGFTGLYSLSGHIDNQMIQVSWGAQYDFDFVSYNLVGYKQ